MNSHPLSRALIDAIRADFSVNWHGIHGVSHWVRVRDNGLRLARLTGASTDVVQLFAFLHDSRRHDDGFDRGHGWRAAEFVRSLPPSLIKLADADFEQLVFAIEYHSEGLVEGDVTVQTCWDADRLDLGRIGFRPDPKYLCTPAAKDTDMIQWAFVRSQLGNKQHSH
jgi:uncharacterized protein